MLREHFTNNHRITQSVSDDSQCQLTWEDCDEKIDLVALGPKEPILFYDEVGIQVLDASGCFLNVFFTRLLFNELLLGRLVRR